MLELQFERNEVISDTSTLGILRFCRLYRSRCLEMEGNAFLTLIRSAPTTLPFLHSFLMRSVMAIMPSSVDRPGRQPMCVLGNRSCRLARNERRWAMRVSRSFPMVHSRVMGRYALGRE